MNQITTRYITENGACYEQYVITDPEAKTALTITPERGGMITSFTLDGEEFVWTRRPNFSECNRPRFGVPVLFPSCGNPAASTTLTARLTPWRPTALPTCAHGKWTALARTV